MSEETEFAVTCAAAEELLAAENLEPLADLERARLRQHLRDCASCRAHHRLLLQFRASLDPEQQPALRPDPAIRQRLRSAVRQQRRPVPLAGFLQRRIPVYQAVLGAAAAVFILFAANSLGPETPRAVAPLSVPRGAEFTRVDSYEVLRKLKLLDARSRGWNNTEDSLLIRFPATRLETTDSI